jgi:hypothetical protein
MGCPELRNKKERGCRTLTPGRGSLVFCIIATAAEEEERFLILQSFYSINEKISIFDRNPCCTVKR